MKLSVKRNVLVTMVKEFQKTKNESFKLYGLDIEETKPVDFIAMIKNIIPTSKAYSIIYNPFNDTAQIEISDDFLLEAIELYGASVVTMLPLIKNVMDMSVKAAVDFNNLKEKYDIKF